MPVPLLTTKLYVPRPRPVRVARPRLIQRLNTGLQRTPGVTLLSAPAGYGKTTLLSEWLEGKLQTPNSKLQIRTAWVSLDEGDNDLPRFLAYLVAALRGVQEGIGESVLAALQPAGLPGAPQPTIETLLTGLINEIATQVPDPFVLVLDDYHLIAEQRIHDTLAFIIDNQPPQMHLVIATRADPPLPLARLRGRGQLTELRQADLCFTPDEVAEFLHRVMGLELSNDDAAALADHTEGWAAGLQMAAVSLRGRDDASRFVQAFAGSDRYVLDYLAEEVLQRQPAHVQDFLLRTSILDRLSGSLCDAVRFGVAETPSSSEGAAVLGEREAESGERREHDLRSTLSAPRMLEYLERTNLFTTPLDNQREWYRYHRLFADLLRKRLHQQVGAQGIAPSHRRASAWYEAHGYTAEAITHALAASDHENAARLVEQAAEATLMHSQVATFLGWVAALPDEMVRARPRLCALHAGALLLGGSPLETVEARLQDTEAAADAPVDAVAVFRGLIAVVQGDRDRGIALSQQALDLLPPESAFLRGIAANALGMAHVLGGDTPAAIQAFETVARIGEQSGNVLSAVGALCNLAGLTVDRGQLHQAAAAYRRALELATDPQGRRLPAASRVLLGLGALAQEWNDLETATSHFQEGLELARRYTELGALFCCLHLARVRQMQGDVDGAEDMIQQARRIAVQVDVTELDDRLVDFAQVRLWLAQGNVAAAARWADAAVTTDAPQFHELREGEELTRARVRLAQGRGDDALALVEPLLQAAERRGRGRRVVDLLALQALTLQAQGDVEGALAALERALALAEPEGYIRTFLDEGLPMARLLERIKAEGGRMKEYILTLLDAFRQETRVEKEFHPSSFIPHPLVEPLSDRELEVLGLIAQGLSNRQVAARLFISLSTVKGHTANIYGKLGVNSRTQAVARARELDLL